MPTFSDDLRHGREPWTPRTAQPEHKAADRCKRMAIERA
jgi:hypothetical protein